MLFKLNHHFIPAVVDLSGLTAMADGQNPSTQLQQRPNILFCIADDQSFPHAGAYGCKWVKTPGNPGMVNGKKRELLGSSWNEYKTTPPAKYISDNDYAANFETFLKDNPDGKPFCFWFGSTEPHRAYEFKAGASKGGKSTSEIDKVFGFWPDNDTVRNDMLDYAFEIEYFDSHIGKM